MEWGLFAVALICVMASSTAHERHAHQHGNAHKATSPGGPYGKHSASHDRGVIMIPGAGAAAGPDVTDEFIVQKMKLMLNQTNNAELVQFLTALNTTEGQAAVKQLGVDPIVVPTLLRQLSGSPQDVAAARTQIQTFIQTFGNVKQRKVSSKVRRLFQIYQMYLIRRAARVQLQQASVDELKAALSALTTEENRFGFRGVNFGDLLQTLTSKGESGRQEVSDKLAKWVDRATIDDLQRASKVVYLKFGNTDVTVTMPPAGNFTTTRPAGNFTTTRPAGNFTTPAGNVTATTTTPQAVPRNNGTTQQPPSTMTSPRPEPQKNNNNQKKKKLNP